MYVIHKCIRCRSLLWRRVSHVLSLITVSCAYNIIIAAEMMTRSGMMMSLCWLKVTCAVGWDPTTLVIKHPIAYHNEWRHNFHSHLKCDHSKCGGLGLLQEDHCQCIFQSHAALSIFFFTCCMSIHALYLRYTSHQVI